MPPQKIGRYEIKSELGRGGMATVYRAQDPSFDREVAVKVLPREFLHDPQFLARFQREIKTIAQLEHPAIVPVYDVGEDDGQPYFVMRNMTGGSLSDWLQQGAFSVQDTARIVERLAKALAYAHKKGIVHRDLKPGNVLFDSAGEAFISDFGVAKLAESASSMTGSGIVGTPAYMSPEQAQSGQIDGRSDVYALGAIIYEMLTGQQPYKADTPMGVVVKHITDPVPEILRDHPDLPAEVDEVIKKAMSKNPNERYATAIELARALNKAAFGNEGNITDPQVTRPRLASPASTSRRQQTVWIAAGAALAVIAALGIFFLIGRQPSGLAEATPTTQAAILPAPAETAVPTPTEASPTPIGGAEQVAFLSGNSIWSMNLDGSEAYPLTTGGDPKSNLQWTRDGQALIYLSGKCAWRFDLATQQAEQIVCFTNFQYLEGFRISPDGQKVAISLDRELIIVPFDSTILKTAGNRASLLKIESACLYNRAAVKDMRWSRDGKSLAAIFRDPASRFADAVRVLDVSRCPPSEPIHLDDFPAGRFQISYTVSPLIPSFDWDGAERFLLNDIVRYERFGNLYLYDMQTRQGSRINPIDNACCYRDAHWSPDGSHVLLLFQDIRLGGETLNLLYYAPAEALTTGDFGQPIPLPLDLKTEPRFAPQFEFRPTP